MLLWFFLFACGYTPKRLVCYGMLLSSFCYIHRTISSPLELFRCFSSLIFISTGHRLLLFLIRSRLLCFLFSIQRHLFFPFTCICSITDIYHRFLCDLTNLFFFSFNCFVPYIGSLKTRHHRAINHLLVIFLPIIVDFKRLLWTDHKMPIKNMHFVSNDNDNDARQFILISHFFLFDA